MAIGACDGLGLAAQGTLMKAHFIDVGQANATLLEFKCGVVLIDAGAQDDEHVDGLVDFITSVFDASPELDRSTVRKAKNDVTNIDLSV